MEYTRQVKLERINNQGALEIYVCYIPERFAKIGKFVVVTEDFGPGSSTISKQWYVKEVYNRRSMVEANLRSRDYIKQRKASDI